MSVESIAAALEKANHEQAQQDDFKAQCREAGKLLGEAFDPKNSRAKQVRRLRLAAHHLERAQSILTFERRERGG